MHNFNLRLIKYSFHFGNRFLLFFFFVVGISCSGTKSTTDERYADTDGLHFNYIFNPKKQGWLYINVNQDSIPFRYSIQKSSLKGFSAKTFKTQKIFFLHYQIDYLREDSFVTYPILMNFAEMIDTRKISNRVYIDMNMNIKKRPIIKQTYKF